MVSPSLIQKNTISTRIMRQSIKESYVYSQRKRHKLDLKLLQDTTDDVIIQKHGRNEQGK